MNNPKVSVVIPVYNRESTIRFTIQSALSQSYSNIEIVVSDNCSTDCSVAIARSFTDSRIKIYQQDRNLGMARNWLKCIELARGEWISFLMSDDVLLADSIHDRVKAAELYSSACVVQTLGASIPLDRLLHSYQETYSRSNQPTEYKERDILRILCGTPKPYSSNPCSFMVKKTAIMHLVNTAAFISYLKLTKGSGHCLDHILLYGSALASRQSSLVRIESICFLSSIHPSQDSYIYSSKFWFLLIGNIRSAYFLAKISTAGQLLRFKIIFFHSYSAIKQYAYDIFSRSCQKWSLPSLPIVNCLWRGDA